MKKLLYLLLLLSTITAPAYGMGGRFSAFKNLYSRFSTKATPTSARLFTPKKLAVATGLTLGTGAAVYAYQNPDKVIQKIDMKPSYKALGYINQKSWLTHYYAKNITTLDQDTFEKILQEDPEAIHVLTQAAAQHIDKVDWNILEKIINKNPDAAKIFAPPAAQHIDKVDLRMLMKIMEQIPDAAQIFIQPAAQHIDKVHWWVLYHLLYKNPQAAEIFTQAAAQRIDKVNCGILAEIIERNPKAAQIFTQPAAQHIDKVDTYVLTKIIDKNPEAAGIFAVVLQNKWQNITSHSEQNLITTLRLNEISEKYRKITNKTLAMNLAHDNSSQTEGHIKNNYPAIADRLSSIILDSESVAFLNKIHRQEEIELVEGRYVFYHACKWQWNYTQDLYTHLLSTLHDKEIPTYRFLRINKDPYTTTYNDSKELKTRNTLLHEGRTYDDQSRKLFFMNHALFGNANTKDCCTVDYWYENRDQSKVTKTSKEIFTKLNQADLYSKYEKDIKELEVLHAKAANKGTFLLLSFSPEFLKETVYAARPHGYLKKVSIDKQETGDVKAILETLKQNPQKLGKSSDKIEYCLILTKDRALNPEYAGKDIKIYPFNMAKPKEYQDYCAKRDELMAKIGTEIKQDKRFGTTNSIPTTDIFWLLS